MDAQYAVGVQRNVGECGMIRLIAIAAMTPKRVIGKDGRVPWHIREELQWFKQRTWGHALVMGRRTFDDIGRVLPGRAIYVLSRSGFSHPGVRVIQSLAELQGNPRIGFIFSAVVPRFSNSFFTIVRRSI